MLQGFDAAVLEELFIVSKVELSQGQELSAVVSAATGEKCPRCWNVTELGGNPNHADVCKRCGDVLDQLA